MTRHTIFLFGEAEKGEFCKPVFCYSLPQMVDLLGHPPEATRGMHYAVQALLYERVLIYYRVREEGFSKEDYMRGLRLLYKVTRFSPISAIGMPGVGDEEIIEATGPICALHKSILLIDQNDLYDFLTCNTMREK